MKDYTQHIIALQLAGEMHKLAPKVEELSTHARGFSPEGLDYDTSVKYSLASERLLKAWEQASYFLFDGEEMEGLR